MQYFDHSTAAAGDSKIAELCIEHGPGAVAAFWVVVEQIYRDETSLVLFDNQAGNRKLTKVVSHWLNVGESQLLEWVSAMLEIGLLEMDPEKPGAVTNRRASENIRAYREKCEIARQNGKKGGRKPTAKPKANQRGNRTQTDAESEGQANKTKQNKGFGFDKQNQKPYAKGGAAAAKAAPPFARCPDCGASIFRSTQTGQWTCPNCGVVKDA